MTQPVPVFSVEDDTDLFLQAALDRMDSSDDDNLDSLLKQFSKARVSALSLVSNMKDSTARRQEVIAFLEEMSVLFFRLGAGMAERETQVNLEARLASLEDKIGGAQESAGYAAAVKADKAKKYSKVQTPSGKAVAPSPKRAVIITPIDEDGGRQPRLAVFGVPSDLGPDELKKELLNNFDSDIDNNRISVKSRFGPRGRPYCHWVVEVDAEIRKLALQRERVYVGWSSCYVLNVRSLGTCKRIAEAR